MHTRIFATDASNAKGAVASASIDVEVNKLLWRSADIKGSNVPLMSRAQAILHTHDEDYEMPTCHYPDAMNDHGVPRPIGLSFDFAEVFGGAGVVTKWLNEFGVVCCPVLDISFSPHYNFTNVRVISWLCFMIEERRIRAVLLAPPCTTFSPAAFPALRSYRNPRGHDRSNPRVLHGNLLAGGSLSIMMTCKRCDAFGVTETPRRSKMRWLEVWQQIIALGAEETFLASCSYGSPHMKEFCLLSLNMDLSSLAKPCTRDHFHIKIEGKYTRPSATYCEGLAKAIAEVFRDHLHVASLRECWQDVNTEGLEDTISNDLAVAYKWRVEDVWAWKGKSHINLLETASTLRLIRRLARSGGDVRVVYLGDSHVSRSSLARGRTSSDAMRPMLRQSAALSNAYGIYLAGRFSPTRSMPANAPTRDKEIPDPVPRSITGEVAERSGIEGLRWLTSLPKTKRWVSNWSRLVLLLMPSLPGFFIQDEPLRIYPATVSPIHHPLAQFDQTLGFPGEGPWLGFSVLLYLCLLPSNSRLASLHGIILSLWISGEGAAAGAPKIDPAAVSHGDKIRQIARAGIELAEGRRTTELTAATRVDLLARFQNWLNGKGISFEDVFLANPPNLDEINKILCDFARNLFRLGKPYYHYSETINSVASRRPLLRRSLQQAWDLAFMWGSFEPTEHHVAMPYQILLALISVMLIWGWRREAACLALSWGALLRIGEVLQAVRSDVVLPSDVAASNDFILVRIKEPKTRYRAARHQAGKLEQPDLIQVISLGFQDLKKEEQLWPYSGSTLRHRLERALQVLGLPHRPGQKPKPLTLASLRPGGATWLIRATESAELVRRRGRWASFRVIEIYLQEVAAETYINDLGDDVKNQVFEAMELFPEILCTAFRYAASSFPSATWQFFFKHGTF